MAPPTKPPGQRVRRNAGQAQWKPIPAEGSGRKPPGLGRRPGGNQRWLASTRDWWETVWASPMAVMWVDADVPALRRLAYMIDCGARDVEQALAFAASIRQLEDRYGLSPKSRRLLQWEITAAQRRAEEEAEEAKGAEASSAAAPAGRRRGDPRLQVLDGGG